MTSEERMVIFASSLGTVFEWYDFYIYGTLAPILAAQFFSGVNPTAAFIFTLLAFAAGFAVRGFVPGEPVAFAQGNRVFELRTYTTADGKLDALHKRFREETVTKFFPRHGMQNVWYGRPMDAPQSAVGLRSMHKAIRRSWR